MYEYSAKITNVVDGDTFDVDVDLGFHIHLHERIRLLEIDTPESRGEEKELGRLCGEYARKNFLGKEVIINTWKTDSFGRWLSELHFQDGSSIVDLYNKLGINKLNDGYKEENCYKL